MDRTLGGAQSQSRRGGKAVKYGTEWNHRKEGCENVDWNYPPLEGVKLEKRGDEHLRFTKTTNTRASWITANVGRVLSSNSESVLCLHTLNTISFPVQRQKIWPADETVLRSVKIVIDGPDQPFNYCRTFARTDVQYLQAVNIRMCELASGETRTRYH